MNGIPLSPEPGAAGAGTATAVDPEAGQEGAYVPPPPGEARNNLLWAINLQNPLYWPEAAKEARTNIQTWYDEDPNTVVERLVQELTLADIGFFGNCVDTMTKAPNYGKFLSCRDPEGRRCSIEFTPDSQTNLVRAVRADLARWNEAVSFAEAHARGTTEHPASPDPDIRKSFVTKILEYSGAVPFPTEKYVRDLVDRGSRISEENPPPLPGEPSPTANIIKI